MTTTTRERRLPGALALGLDRTVVELKVFFRNPEAAFFLLALPILLLVVFGAIFNFEIEGPPGEEPVSFRQYFVAGMIAGTVMSASFSNLAIGIAIEQHVGYLKRLAGTPLPRSAYFIGKVLAGTLVAASATAVMMAIGVLLYGLALPDDLGAWLRLVWIFVLGVAAASLLGIAYTRLIPNAKSAPAIVTPPFLLLQFISGVFIQFDDLPPVMQQVAAVFPLKWLAQGLRSVFLPDWFAREEVAGSFEVGRVALVLALWTVAGFVLTVLLFRWRRRGDR